MAEPVRQDKDFDAMGAAWDRSIYGSTKGFIRSEVLWEDMTAQIPGLAEGRLSVLDAGGGSGRLAARMAKSGNRVTLCDPSGEMLTIARGTAEEAGVADESRLAPTGTNPCWCRGLCKGLRGEKR